MKKSLIPALFLGLTLAACAAPSDNAANTNVAAAIKAAEQATARVDEVGYAWRDTGTMIEDARKAAEQGETEQALALANEARQQSELAWEQYERNKNAGPNF